MIREEERFSILGWIVLGFLALGCLVYFIMMGMSVFTSKIGSYYYLIMLIGIRGRAQSNRARISGPGPLGRGRRELPGRLLRVEGRQGPVPTPLVR
jgi:hypothetical protein